MILDISYALFMYLARISRLFFEDKIYQRNIENGSYNITETLKQHQIKVIKLIRFIVYIMSLNVITNENQRK
jgi:hypothetical protein